MLIKLKLSQNIEKKKTPLLLIVCHNMGYANISVPLTHYSLSFKFMLLKGFPIF